MVSSDCGWGPLPGVASIPFTGCRSQSGPVHARRRAFIACEIPVPDALAAEHTIPRPGRVNEEIVDVEDMLLGHRAHHRKARILVPTAALVKPGVRQERRAEEQDLGGPGDPSNRRLLAHSNPEMILMLNARITVLNANETSP